MKTLTIALTSIILYSCFHVKYNRLQYYDPNYKLDNKSHVRTDGYYLVSSEKKYSVKTQADTTAIPITKLDFGFVQFFEDGFCFVGAWDGLYTNKNSIDSLLRAKKERGYWGIYKINHDTLFIEYPHKYYHTSFKIELIRTELTSLIKLNKLIFYDQNLSTKYRNCVGEFNSTDLRVDTATNTLKKDINLFLTPKK